jgi:transposase
MMIHVTAQMRVLVAIEPVDGRKRIDSLVRVCQAQLGEDPFSGCVFFFRNRSAKSILILAYDGQGYWVAQKRLSKRRFTWWPASTSAAQTAGGLPSSVADGGWGCVASPCCRDVAASQRADIATPWHELQRKLPAETPIQKPTQAVPLS